MLRASNLTTPENGLHMLQDMAAATLAHVQSHVGGLQGHVHDTRSSQVAKDELNDMLVWLLRCTTRYQASYRAVWLYPTFTYLRLASVCPCSGGIRRPQSSIRRSRKLVNRRLSVNVLGRGMAGFLHIVVPFVPFPAYILSSIAFICASVVNLSYIVVRPCTRLVASLYYIGSLRTNEVPHGTDVAAWCCVQLLSSTCCVQLLSSTCLSLRLGSGVLGQHM